MKKLGKKKILVFIVFVLILFILTNIILLLIKSKGTAQKIDTQLANFENTFSETNNESMPTKDENITENTVENTTEIVQENSYNNTPQNNVTEKQITKETHNKSSQKATNSTASSNKEIKKQKQSSTTSTSNKASTSPAPKQSTISSQTPETTTIKKITNSELNSENIKYLNDIKSIKPGLKYINSKRGQCFYPYKTSEITKFTNGLSFGTIYYYVDTFVEGNQEKFKYYIDWAGN